MRTLNTAFKAFTMKCSNEHHSSFADLSSNRHIDTEDNSKRIKKTLNTFEHLLKSQDQLSLAFVDEIYCTYRDEVFAWRLRSIEIMD